MSSNDGLNLIAIVAGVRAVVDAVDTALELWHRLPLDVGAEVDTSRWALGITVDFPHPDDPGAYPALGLSANVGPWHGWLETTRRGDDGRPPVLDLDEDPFPGRVTLTDTEVAALREHLDPQRPWAGAVAEAGAR